MPQYQFQDREGMQKSKRGGARPGAGRPKSKVRRVTMSVVVAPETAATLRAPGEKPGKKIDSLFFQR